MFNWVLNTPLDTFSKFLSKLLWRFHPFSPLPPNKSRRYTNQVFFNLVTPSLITTSDIFKSPQVRFLIVWSILNYFTVHQPAVKNSMLFKSTDIPIYSTSNRRHIWNPAMHLRWGLFCENSQFVEAVGCFREGAPSWMLDRILNATLPK